MRPIALILATVGVGYLPGAPGTYGAVVGALLTAWALAAGLALGPYLAGTLLLSVVGVWAATAACRAWETKDDGRVVIDEVAGQLLAGAPILWLGSGASPWPALAAAFILFRFFDIAKPGPVRLAERRFADGLGVMADDLVAGLLAALLLAAGLAWLAR